MYFVYQYIYMHIHMHIFTYILHMHTYTRQRIVRQSFKSIAFQEVEIDIPNFPFAYGSISDFLNLLAGQRSFETLSEGEAIFDANGVPNLEYRQKNCHGRKNFYIPHGSHGDYLKNLFFSSESFSSFLVMKVTKEWRHSRLNHSKYLSVGYFISRHPIGSILSVFFCPVIQ